MTKLITAINIGFSAMMTEHLFTFTESSLPSTKRFFSKDDKGKQDVRKAYVIATILSIGFASIISYLLKNAWGVICAGLMSLVFIYLYERALKGEI